MAFGPCIPPPGLPMVRIIVQIRCKVIIWAVLAMSRDIEETYTTCRSYGHVLVLDVRSGLISMPQRPIKSPSEL